MVKEGGYPEVSASACRFVLQDTFKLLFEFGVGE